MKTFLSRQNHALLRELVRTDFKLRYQGSILGYAWSLLKPLFIFVIQYVVFVYFLQIGKGIEHYAVILLFGIVLWNFFSEMTLQSLTSIVGRGDLIRKIRIPRWMIVFSASISALINLFLSLIIVFIFAVVNHVPFTWTVLLLPLNILLIYMLALGVSLFLSALYVRFRDISYIWEIVLQAGFYATPIFYPVSFIPSVLIQKLLLLNPMAEAIQSARYNVLSHGTPTIFTLWGTSLFVVVPFAITIIVLTVGLLYFKKQAPSFAENI